MKFCKDCEYWSLFYGLCERPTDHTPNPVSGGPSGRLYRNARSERKPRTWWNRNRCGTDAAYFTPKADEQSKSPLEMDDILLRALVSQHTHGGIPDGLAIALAAFTMGSKAGQPVIEKQAAEIARLKAQAEKLVGALEALTARMDIYSARYDDALVTMARAVLSDYRGK